MSEQKKISTWGGRRENAGRPRKKKTTSEKVKYAWMKAARELAKEHGMSFEKAILSMAYDSSVQHSVKASIAKTYNEVLVSKESHQDITITKDKGMAVMLPEKLPDPALKLVKKEG